METIFIMSEKNDSLCNSRSASGLETVYKCDKHNRNDFNNFQLLVTLVRKGKELQNFFYEKGEDSMRKIVNESAPPGGLTVLHYAAMENNITAIKELIKFGADVNARGKRKTTPLHYAASLNVARLLIENGADVNAIDSLGKNALFHAFTRDDFDTVKFLLMPKNNVDFTYTKECFKMPKDFTRDDFLLTLLYDDFESVKGKIKFNFDEDEL